MVQRLLVRLCMSFRRLIEVSVLGLVLMALHNGCSPKDSTDEASSNLQNGEGYLRDTGSLFSLDGFSGDGSARPGEVRRLNSRQPLLAKQHPGPIDASSTTVGWVNGGDYVEIIEYETGAYLVMERPDYQPPTQPSTPMPPATPSSTQSDYQSSGWLEEGDDCEPQTGGGVQYCDPSHGLRCNYQGKNQDGFPVFQCTTEQPLPEGAPCDPFDQQTYVPTGMQCDRQDAFCCQYHDDSASYTCTLCLD
jgi:hypothetical protein